MFASMNETWTHCRIRSDDEIHIINDGMVIVNGPDATVYEFQPSTDRHGKIVSGGRFNQVDLLQNVDAKPGRDGQYVLTGDSAFLLSTVGAPEEDTRITITVSPQGGGCKDCP
jgi:hypothetical protein